MICAWDICCPVSYFFRALHIISKCVFDKEHMPKKLILLICLLLPYAVRSGFSSPLTSVLCGPGKQDVVQRRVAAVGS